MSDSWQPIFAMVAAIMIISVIILWLGAVVWAYRDSKERSRDPWTHIISAALVLVFNLPGLVLYLLIRPRDTLVEAYERRLENEALMAEMPERRTCPACQRPARQDYLFCPYCRTALRQACTKCTKPLELNWTACPFCGAAGPQQMAMPTMAASQPPTIAATPSQPPKPMATEATSPTRGTPSTTP